MASYGDWDLRAKLRTLTVPTLVVHGEEESIPMDLVEEWVTSMPNARLLKVPRAAHFTYAERPELVWPAVERFLAGRRSNRILVLAALHWRGHMIVGIIVGIIAGFLAGQFMNGSGYGIVMDLLLGLFGGIVGGFVLGLVGIGASGIIGSVLVSTFGAVLLIWIVRWIKSNRGAA